MKASSFFQTTPGPTTNIVNNTSPDGSSGSELSGGLKMTGLSGSLTGALYSAVHSDDNFHDVVNKTNVSGVLKGLCCVALSGLFTSGDVFSLNVQVDGAAFLSQGSVTVTAIGDGLVAVGSVADDGAGNSNIISTGSVRFNSSLLIQVKVVRAGATSTPRVWGEIEYT